MKTLRKSIWVITTAIALFSCEKDEFDTPSVGSDLPMEEYEIIDELSKPAPNLASMRNRGMKVTESPVLDAASLEVVGTSHLVRMNDRLLAIFKTELELGTANTLWWVFFNQAENCVGECDDPDLENPDTRADVVYADGEIVRRNGQTIFVARRRVGDTNGSVAPLLWDGIAYGLEDAHMSEVHLVVRSHGPVIPGLEQEMISTFNGGCQGFHSSLGTPGPNTCVDVQFASHLVNLF